MSTPAPGSALRVCLVTPYDLAEAGGGVKHHILELARGLRGLGDQVTVLGPATGGLAVPSRLGEVVGLPGVVNIRSNGSDNRMGLFVSPWRIRRFLRANTFDVLHIHEPPVPALTYWAAWLAPRRVTKIATFHAFTETPSTGKQLGQRVSGALVNGCFDHAIAVSPAAARYAGIAWKRPWAILPNGVALDVFKPLGPAGPPPDRRAAAPLQLLFIGRLSDERKGFRFLIEAYKLLRARGVEVTLEVVGERAGAPEPPPLAGLHYHGPVGRAALVERYQHCDLFVAPSTGQESFGIVLVEAMAAGRPIVCSDIEGYRFAADPRGASFVPPGDPAALAAAIETLAGDREARRAMSAFNLEFVKRYSWSTITALVRTEYLRAIEAHQQGRRRLDARPSPP